MLMSQVPLRFFGPQVAEPVQAAPSEPPGATQYFLPSPHGLLHVMSLGQAVEVQSTRHTPPDALVQARLAGQTLVQATSQRPDWQVPPAPLGPQAVPSAPLQ